MTIAITKQTKFFLAIALQLVIIFSIIIFKVAILAGGTEVLLRIEPVDPRDFLRGDYITFQYAISNLNPYLAGGELINNGDSVYVVLQQSGKFWIAQSIKKTMPAKGKTFIKGHVSSGGAVGKGDINSYRYQTPSYSNLHVVYGIEDYYIPEGQGSNLNLRGNQGNAFVQVMVDENGNAVLKKLFINDKPWP